MQDGGVQHDPGCAARVFPFLDSLDTPNLEILHEGHRDISEQTYSLFRQEEFKLAESMSVSVGSGLAEFANLDSLLHVDFERIMQLPPRRNLALFNPRIIGKPDKGLFG